MKCAIPSQVQKQPIEPGDYDPGQSAAVAATAKRAFDVFFSACGLVVLSPLLLVVAAFVKISDGGSVLYRQFRVGRHGQPFLICKFRTMVPGADSAGPLITGSGDPRITRLGRFLRKTKLDELPQLWNVLKGEMSLVGPRPEVPKYVAYYTSRQRNILKLKPGITDPASVHFRNEEMLLKYADDVEAFYTRHCIPKKLQLNFEYAEKANLASDTWIILQTICPYWICVLTIYSLILAAGFWLSYLLVYDSALPNRLHQDSAGWMFAIVSVQLGALIWRRQCRGLLSYFSLPELKQLAAALSVACLLSLCLRTLANPSWLPRNLILIDALLSLCALGGFRLLLRMWREHSSSVEVASQNPPLRVGIIGAGDTGIQLARELTVTKEFGRTVLAFFDDDFRKWRRCIHEIPVIGMPECLLDGWAGKLDEVIIAIPKGPAKRIQEISQLLQKAGVKAYTAPSPQHVWPRNGDRFPPNLKL